MRLNRLTGLEQEKLTDEYKELLTTIAGLIAILEDPEKLLKVIRDELAEIKEQYGDERRTVIQSSQEDLDVLDLIAPEDVVVTLSHAGYAKRQPVSIYRAQRRGGRGRIGDRDEGRGFRRAAVDRQHARHAARVHERGPRVSGSRCTSCRTRARTRAASRS